MIALIKKNEYLSEIRPEAFALTSDPSASLIFARCLASAKNFYRNDDYNKLE
jgi:hypothetical protein